MEYLEIKNAAGWLAGNLNKNTTLQHSVVIPICELYFPEQVDSYAEQDFLKHWAQRGQRALLGP